MSERYILYSALGSGGVAVEAALTLMKADFDVVEAPTFDPGDKAGGDRVLGANLLRQVPALRCPSGEIVTESAAILQFLAERHPEARLAPSVDAAARGAFLRWMAFIASAVYAHYWVKDDPSRLVADPRLHAEVNRRIEDRISTCWATMEAAVEPGLYVLGDQLTVLDLYLTVVSRFRPRRQRFYDVAPRLGAVVRRVDADPRLKDLWTERYPFFEGWDRVQDADEL